MRFVRELSGGSGFVPLIDHFATHYRQQDLRIQNLWLSNGGQIPIEYGEILQLPDFA